MSAPVQVRPRDAADLPGLVRVLAGQQAWSGYPMRWPLPMPVEEFIARPGEEAAWVAEVAGRVVGHGAVGGPIDEERVAFERILGTSAIAAVTTLFVDLESVGTGVGGRLLDAAVHHITASGRLPVLDVVGGRAYEVYQRRGWVVVGTHRPPWLPADRDPVWLMALGPEDALSAGRSRGGSPAPRS